VKFYRILLCSNGFSKEEEVKCKEPPVHLYIVRDYPFLNTISPDDGPVTVKDTRFILRECFYALGRNIALYKEEI